MGQPPPRNLIPPKTPANAGSLAPELGVFEHVPQTVLGVSQKGSGVRQGVLRRASAVGKGKSGQRRRSLPLQPQPHSWGRSDGHTYLRPPCTHVNDSKCLPTPNPTPGIRTYTHTYTSSCSSRSPSVPLAAASAGSHAQSSSWQHMPDWRALPPN